MQDKEKICEECCESKPLRVFERDGRYESICYLCRVSSVKVGKPSDFASKTRVKQKKRELNNSWNRGVPTDSRGMPFLGPDLQPMGIKKVVEKSHLIEETRRRNRQAPLPPTPREVI